MVVDASEGVFIDLILASQRVAEWLDVLRSAASVQRYLPPPAQLMLDQICPIC